MTRKLYLLLVSLLACGLIAAGCGDDDDDGGGSDEPAATQEDTGGGGTDTPEDVDVPDDVAKQAAEACKQQITSAQGVDESLKDELNDLCEKAASGDQEAAREASQKLCEAVAESVPAGPGRDAARDACEQSFNSQ